MRSDPLFPGATLTTPTAGLISALAFSTDPASGMYAAGSYTGRGSVCFYTEDTGERCVGELELGEAAGRGVTQVGQAALITSCGSS